MISRNSFNPIRKLLNYIDNFSKEFSDYFLLFFAIILCVLLGIIVSSGQGAPWKDLKEGDVIKVPIKAPRDIFLEDSATLEKKRREAEAKVIPIFDYDSGILDEIEEKIRGAFSSMREGVEMGLEIDIGDQEKIFEQMLGFEISSDSFSALFGSGFPDEISEEIIKLMGRVYEKGVIESKELLKDYKKKMLLLRKIGMEESPVLITADMIYDISSARRELQSYINRSAILKTKNLRIAAYEITSNLLKPNVILNSSDTERAKMEALSRIKPTFVLIKKGEVIFREGEKIDRDNLYKLRVLKEMEHGGSRFLNISAMSLLIFMLIWVTWYFSSKNIKKFASDKRDYIFLGLWLLTVVALSKFGISIAKSLEVLFPFVPLTVFYYTFPVAAGAMVVRIVINSETAIAFSIILSLITGILLQEDFLLSIYYFIGSIFASHFVKQCTSRKIIFRAGFYLGVVNMFMAMALTGIKGEFVTTSTLWTIPLPMLGGIAASIMTSGFVPLAELIFGYTTDMKLLELANIDHPLIKELMIRAPGTYHHSVMVGSLVEAAAEAIGANPLLSRVCALYHDIGKIKMPEYFIENQIGDENKHDKLSPHMSALIVISHVKSGIELAKEAGIGKRIIDVIPQHHGTSVITYFYQKALEKEGEDNVNENDFRYLGPKPQTREAGLVMLADIVEAAVRVLPDPNPGRIQQIVHRLINKVFTDGQLDECELTLKDLTAIEKAFVRVLSGIYHHRVDYPETYAADKRKANGNSDSKQAKIFKGKQEDIKKGSKEDFKRFAIS